MSTLPEFIIAIPAHFLSDHPYLAVQSKQLAEAYSAEVVIEDAQLQQVGQHLWQALACDEAFLAAEQESGQAALNVVIETDQPRVLSLAWETLYHPKFGFLAKDERFTLSRRIPMQPAPRLPAVETTPLRILLFAAMPMDGGERGRLQVEDEKANILQAIAPLEDQGLVQLIAPDDGRFESFKAALQQHQPHLVYLSGHGNLHHNTLDNTYQGRFLFEDSHANSLEVSEDELVNCFNNTQVQALVLSACESGKSDPRDLNNGLTIRLAQKGIPHVIGMRESILDNAGLEFATTFLQRIAAKQPLGVALQAARAAIKSHTIGYVSREQQSNPVRTAIIQQQWCLPILISHTISQPLVNWSFTPQPKSFTLNFNRSLEAISLPQQFLGRKKELYQLLQPLLDGTQKQLLLSAAGGMGKTALAGKLCDSLKQAGFEVFAYSARAGNEWTEFVRGMELSLAPEISPKYDAQKPRLNEQQQAQFLLQCLLMQYQGKLVLFLDNLESVQDPQSRALTDKTLAGWLNIAKGLSQQGLRLILTSRWCLPDWDQAAHHALEKPAFSDFIAFARQRGLLSELSAHQRSREVYEVLGGNFRAFEFFVKASQGMSLSEESTFLTALDQAKGESQTDMALARVLAQRSEAERELLRRLMAYPVAVPMKGVSVLALWVEPALAERAEHVDYLNNLVAVSLVERIDNREFTDTDYQLAPLLRDYLEQQGAQVAANTLKTAALYLHDDLLEARPRLDLALRVHEVLLASGEVEKAQALLLKRITGVLNRAGLYRTLIKDYLEPSLALSHPPKILAQTQNQIGIQYLHTGNFSTALRYLQQSLAIRQEIGDKSGEGTTLNNISQIYDARGDYDTALRYLQQALAITQEIGDKSGEGKTLNNISQIYAARGDYDTALRYLQQSLAIQQEIGDKSGEGATLNNIATAAHARGDYDTALRYLQQALAIRQEIGDKSGEGATLNNISQIFRARGDYDTALRYLQQSLAIRQEIGDKYGLCATLINMGHIQAQNQEIQQAVATWVAAYAVSKEIGHAQALAALESLAPQIGLAGGLAGWEALLQISRE
ncbi:MAG: tetratricopeptide repeat protein [Thiofilum sp.]|uniref:tetratricopeptide repeat protein n=1 Tax=Thiofilum sp. TaxID=2212733 RepID=UPI003BAEB447